MSWKYNPHTDEQDYYQLSDGVYLKLDQSTPETVYGGMPIFSGGINLNNSTLENVNYVEFNVSFADGTAEGRLQWNSDDGTLEVGMPGGSVNLQIGQETLLRVKNGEATDIPNGAVVYISDAAESRPVVKLADNSDILTSYVVGVATETISTQGFVTLTGLVRDVNTGGMTEGLPIWLNTSGGFTQTRPDAPAISVLIGYVLKAHASEGIIAVRPTVIPRLEGLSDTYGTPDTAGQFFVWDTTDSRFELLNINDWFKLDQTTPQDVVPLAGTTFSLGYADVAGGGFGVFPKIKFTNSNVLGFPQKIGLIDNALIIHNEDDNLPLLTFLGTDIVSYTAGVIQYDSTSAVFTFNPSVTATDQVFFNMSAVDAGSNLFPLLSGIDSSGGSSLFLDTNIYLYDSTDSGSVGIIGVSQDFSEFAFILVYEIDTGEINISAGGGVNISTQGTGGVTQDALTLAYKGIGDGSDNDGVRLSFQHRSDAGLLGTSYTAGYIDCIQTDATEGSMDSYLAFGGYTAGATGEWLKLDGTNIEAKSTLKTSSGRVGKITTVADTYVILISDETIICNKATDFTVTLPTTTVGQIFTIKNINTGTVTLNGNGSDTIDGETSQEIQQWESIKLQCYAANKWVIL